MLRAPEAVDDLTQPATHARWWVLALIFVIYTVAAADRANIGIVLPNLQKYYGLSNSQAGTIVSLFFVAYAIGQIPAAFLIKRTGVRAIIPVSLFVTSIMTAAHGLVNSVIALKAARLALGAAEAPIGTACMTTINNWFPASEKGTATGLFQAAAKFGPVIAPPLGAAIIVAFGWHWVFLLFAVPGLLLPLVWMSLVPDNPADSRFVNETERKLIQQPPTIAPVPTMGEARVPTLSRHPLDQLLRARPVRLISRSSDVFRSWNLWGVALSYLVLAGTMYVILAWIPKYLLEVKHFAILNVGFVASAPFVGAVLGNLFGGWASDRFLGRRRKPLMMLSCLSAVVMMNALRFAPENIILVALLLLLTGFLLSVGFALFPIFPSGFTEKQTFTIAISLLNTCGQIGGALLPLLTGVILDRGSWDDVFLMLSTCGAIAFVLLLTVEEPRGVIARADDT